MEDSVFLSKESDRSLRKNSLCNICNKYFATFKKLVEHFDVAQHKVLVEHYPKNGVKLRGLKRGYDAPSLITLINGYGTTIFNSCSPHRKYASFVFKETHSAKALLAASKVEFLGQSVIVMPLQMKIPSELQHTYTGQSLKQSGSVNKKTLPLATQAPLPTDHPKQLTTSTKSRRLRRKRQAQRLYDNRDSLAPDSEQEPSNETTATPQQKSIVEEPKTKSTRDGTEPVRAVCVWGFGTRSDFANLKDLMGTFGKISQSKCTMRGKCAYFVYQKPSSAAAVLNHGQLEFNGRKPVVQPLNKPKQQGAVDNFPRVAQRAIGLVNKSLPIEEQLAELEHNITDSPEVREGQVASMLSDVSNAVCRIYPNLVLHPFGSSATGLAFFNSDLDLFMELPVPDKRCVQRVTEQLRRVGHPFKEVVPVAGAKTPLVKFRHALTGLSCDISFRNCLGVRNSRLLRHYMDMHPLVRQLMMVVKLWAQVQGISSSRGGATSYALGLMVIFFLQKFGIVPPVADLLYLEDRSETVDGWACGFCCDLEKVCIEESLANLLKSFFSFYSNFEWKKFVVCPLLGSEVDREDLLDPDKLPPEMGPLKTKLVTNESMGFQSESSKAMCVQDPFVLDHNLTRGIVPSKACEIFNLLIVSDQAIALKSDSLLLPALLSTQNARTAEAMTSRLCRVSIPLPLEENDKWISCLWRHLAKVLTSVLKLRVTKVISGKNDRNVELDCCGFHDTITGRARVEEELLAENGNGFKKLSPIAQQVAISDRLLGLSVVNKPLEAKRDDSGETKTCDSVTADVAGDLDEGEVNDMHLKNQFGVLEDLINIDSDSEDGLEEAENGLATNDVDATADKKANGNRQFTFMKDVNFPWDYELVDPEDCKPKTQFVVKGSRRKQSINIHFQNNGPFDKFVSALTICLECNLADWILAEMKQGC